MSQDGDAAERYRAEHEVPSLREQVAALQAKLAQTQALVAGLVLTYGEFVSTGHKRAAVAGGVLERVAGAHLSVHMDPVSGSVLLHVREG